MGKQAHSLPNESKRALTQAWFLMSFLKTTEVLGRDNYNASREK
jgi:hypothetical protein